MRTSYLEMKLDDLHSICINLAENHETGFGQIGALGAHGMYGPRWRSVGVSKPAADKSAVSPGLASLHLLVLTKLPITNVASVPGEFIEVTT